MHDIIKKEIIFINKGYTRCNDLSNFIKFLPNKLISVDLK